MILYLYINGDKRACQPIVIEKSGNWKQDLIRREKMIEAIVDTWHAVYFEDMERKNYDIVLIAQSSMNRVPIAKQHRTFDPCKKYQRVPKVITEQSQPISRVEAKYSNRNAIDNYLKSA